MSGEPQIITVDNIFSLNSDSVLLEIQNKLDETILAPSLFLYKVADILENKFKI